MSCICVTENHVGLQYYAVYLQMHSGIHFVKYSCTKTAFKNLVTNTVAVLYK